MSDPASSSLLVLFVDDDGDLRTLAGRMLAKYGHRFKLAGDGGEAIRLLQAEPFDVLVLDIIMPGKEGIETIVEVRQQWPNLPILAISGAIPAPQVLELARQVGAHGFLAKPFSALDLQMAILDVKATADAKG